MINSELFSAYLFAFLFLITVDRGLIGRPRKRGGGLLNTPRRRRPGERRLLDRGRRSR